MKIKVAAISEVGFVRGNNEDNLYMEGKRNRQENVLKYEYGGEESVQKEVAYAVFDGMGGLPHGEVASRTASQALHEIMQTREEWDYADVIRELNTSVCEKKQEYRCSLGTTAAVLFLEHSKAVAVNVGDSRIYFFREKQMKQISKDHTERSIALEMQKELGIHEDIYRGSTPDSLTQFLGIDEEEFILEPEIREICDLKEKDRFLLCSDGLWNGVPDARIQQTVENTGDLQECARRLRDQALEAGGKDNITIVLVEIRAV